MDIGSVEIRWAGRRHVASVLEIENRSFNAPWDEKKFLHYAAKRNHIFKVCESRSGEIYGFAIYELADKKFNLINLAVAPEVRRTGVGSLLVNHIKEKTNFGNFRRPHIDVMLLESNVPAQLFFSHLGFDALGVTSGPEHGYYEDLYHFRYSAPTPVMWNGVNRISQYFET